MPADRDAREKHPDYYGQFRPEILRLIPAGTRTLLDVGCGDGTTTAKAKQELGIREVVGIEAHEPAAALAASRLDRVIRGDLETLVLDLPKGHFDCILCADILEHLRDPWQVLRDLRPCLREDGVLIASIPNLRHLKPIFMILFDRFEYEPSGILDRTHLRFFTFHTMKQLLNESGFVIRSVETNRSAKWPVTLLNILSLGLLRPFSVAQYLIVAHKSRP